MSTPSNVPPVFSTLSDEEVLATLRLVLPDFYFVNTPLSRMRRHLELLARVLREPVILDFHRPAGAHFTELTLCAYDDAQPGLLSKVVGTLAALKITVHTAWIHTLCDVVENGADVRWIVLDTLILSEPHWGRVRPLSKATETRVSTQLRAILEGKTSVAGLLNSVGRRAHAPLRLYELSAAPAADAQTLLKLRAADDNALLYRITRALASLDLNIAHAQINTFDKSADDVFFVRHAHEPIKADEIEALLARLRAALENEGRTG